MANSVRTTQTTLPAEDVIVRAVQFFSNQSWRATSQTNRSVTFQGKPKIPWFMLLLTFIGFVMCILPGVILYIFVIMKMYGFVNMVVTANSVGEVTEVSISHPGFASGLVKRFSEALPKPPSAAEDLVEYEDAPDDDGRE